MLRRAAAVWLVLPLTLAAQVADPSQSAACRDALRDLQAWDAAASLASAAARPQREGLRRRAAQTCLGGPADAPLQRPQAVTAPIAVRPGPPPRPLPAPPATTPPAAGAARSPTALTACDATGCWASDGTRVQRMGPNLVGPRGVCSVSAGVLLCP